MILDGVHTTNMKRLISTTAAAALSCTMVQAALLLPPAHAVEMPPNEESAATNPDAMNASGFGQTVVVRAWDQARLDAPAWVALSIKPEELASVHLVETTDGTSRHVTAQVEPGTPPRLWWIVEGELPVGARRSYRIEARTEIEEALVSVDQTREALRVRNAQSTVLQYNMAHVEPPPGADPKYGRSAFMHPLRTPAGAIVTDQFPPDHLHQSGIFLAYTKTEFEGRTPNFWDLLGGTGLVRFKELARTTQGPLFGEFNVVHEHVDLTAPDSPHGKVALLETWQVRVWNVGAGDPACTICDVTSSIMCATSSPLRLLEYHYGGMAFRGARGWDPEHARIVTSEGKDRIEGNQTRPRWCDLSGPVDDQTAGITFLTHPGNFRSPEPLRIHPTMPYMVYTPSQLGDWEITPGQPHVSRYRFVAHDGDLDLARTERIWLNFVDPLVATSVSGR